MTSNGKIFRAKANIEFSVSPEPGSHIQRPILKVDSQTENQPTTSSNNVKKPFCKSAACKALVVALIIGAILIAGSGTTTYILVARPNQSAQKSYGQSCSKNGDCGQNKGLECNTNTSTCL